MNISELSSPVSRPTRFKGQISRGLLSWGIFIILAIGMVWMLKSTEPPRQNVSLTQFQTQLRAGNISSITIQTDEIVGTFKTPPQGDGVNFRTELPTGTISWSFVQWLLENSGGADVKVNNTSNLLSNIILPLIPWLLIFGFIWFFVFRRLKRGFGPTMTQTMPGGSSWVYSNVTSVPPPNPQDRQQ